MAHFPQNKGIFALFANISKSIHTPFKILVHALECTRKGGTPMKETTPPKDPKKKLWIGYAAIIAILFACNLFLFPAMMQAKVKSVNYSTFLQMLENKQLSTVQIEDQQIYTLWITRITPTRPTPSPRITTWSPGWRMQGSSLALSTKVLPSGTAC